jgi:hypothetical protein
LLFERRRKEEKKVKKEKKKSNPRIQVTRIQSFMQEYRVSTMVDGPANSTLCGKV